MLRTTHLSSQTDTRSITEQLYAGDDTLEIPSPPLIQWQYHHHSYSGNINTTHSPLTAANTLHYRDILQDFNSTLGPRQVTIGHDGKRRRTVEAEAEAGGGAGAGEGAGVALLPHTEAVYKLLQPGWSHSHTVDRSPPHSTPRPDSQRAGEESGDWRAVLL